MTGHPRVTSGSTSTLKSRGGARGFGWLQRKELVKLGRARGSGAWEENRWHPAALPRPAARAADSSHRRCGERAAPRGDAEGMPIRGCRVPPGCVPGARRPHSSRRYLLLSQQLPLSARSGPSCAPAHTSPHRASLTLPHSLPSQPSERRPAPPRTAPSCGHASPRPRPLTTPANGSARCR